MANKCLDCKYSSVKIKILVPHNKTIQEYVHRTGDFQSDIVAIVKEREGQYTFWFRSEGDIKLLIFKLLNSCKLKIEKSKKEAACIKHEAKEGEEFISNIIYSRVPASEIVAT